MTPKWAVWREKNVAPRKHKRFTGADTQCECILLLFFFRTVVAYFFFLGRSPSLACDRMCERDQREAPKRHENQSGWAFIRAAIDVRGWYLSAQYAQYSRFHGHPLALAHLSTSK